MRKLIAGIIGVLLFVVLAVVVVQVRSEPTTTGTVVYLNLDQAKALKQVDDSLVTLKKQFDDLQTQRAALITGFALSTPKVSSAGFEWSKKYQFEEAANGWSFRELTAEEQQARAAQQAQPR